MKIGLCLPIGERGPERRPPRYQEMRALALMAEHGNLDSVWVADHIFFLNEGEEPRGIWESMTMLAALAEATTKVEFGPLVMCTPFRNPGLIAWMANTLEEISGGRFVLASAPAGTSRSSMPSASSSTTRSASSRTRSR